MPRRARSMQRSIRWPNNLGVAALNSLLMRLILPAGTVGFALAAEPRRWGLLHSFELPASVAVIAAVVALDFVIYLQHVLFHAVPVLWRFHRMHHADLDFDVTTGIRFHPVEMVLSMGVRVAAIAALGAPATGVLAFELLLNATSMFNHSNLRIPAPADRIGRLLVVTPDMHRVHHSVLAHEANSNFGFNLPWWDRLLGTYRPQPEDGHERMTVGIREFRDQQELRLYHMLLQPLRVGVGGYPINRNAA